MTRRATIRTVHADPEVVAAALAPDNTDEMETCVERDEDGRRVVVTTIERDSTSGLQSTVDDTLVNLAVADQVAALTPDDATTNVRGDTTDVKSDATAERESTTTAAESIDDRQQTDTNDTS